MDDLIRIHTFIKVAQLGGFSVAARALNTSITSVARQVNSLESELKVRLITRSSRSLALTEPGKLFYQRVCLISTDLRAAMQEATSFQETVKGTLRISMRPSTGNSVIVPALPKFLEKYPDLQVHVSFTDERRDLIANDIDVAIWMGAIPDSDVVARCISRSQRIVCASPEYLKSHGIPKIPEDLRDHNCLLFDARTYSNKWVFTKNNIVHEIPVNGAIRSDNGLALYSAALAGAGLMVGHEWAVRSLIAQGRLVSVLSDYTVKYSTIDGDLYAVYPSSRGVSRKVRVFVDFLVELFSESPAAPGDSGRTITACSPHDTDTLAS